MREVIATEAELVQLATGFRFTEGPAWHGPEKKLIFSDIPASTQYVWCDAEGCRVSRRETNMANGNTYDNEWRLVTCEHAASRLTRQEPDGTVTVLADSFDGKDLDSPNDVVVKGDGTIYFTDPTFGRQEFFGRPRPVAQDVRGVYRLDGSDGSLTRVAGGFSEPNGLCFSPDEDLLYVNDTPRGKIFVFPVLGDGSLGERREFAKPTGPGEGSPDGMKTDVSGRLYSTGPGGIHVFAVDGACLGVIPVPEVVGNFTWGGPARTDLYVCASTSLYRIPVNVRGNVR